MEISFKKDLWVSFGIIVGSILIASGAIYYYSGLLGTQAHKIVVDRSLIQQQTVAISNLATLKQDAPKAAQYETAINQLLPDQYGLLSFGSWLTALGQKDNVTTGYSFGGNPTSPGNGSLGAEAFTLQAQGSPTDIVHFLNDLEAKSNSFLLALQSFDFASDGATVRLSGQGSLFFQ